VGEKTFEQGFDLPELKQVRVRGNSDPRWLFEMRSVAQNLFSPGMSSRFRAD
jgi:hypothetical protein